MTNILLEVCVEDAAGLQAAVDGGADRVELCSALSVGGLTPSPGLMALAGKVDIPVYAMIRPRPGDFVFDAGDMDVMRVEIEAARSAGLAGVVLGASRPDGSLDKEALKTLVAGSKFKAMPRFAREPEGYIALQHHDGGDVWFRNVRVRALGTPARAAAPAPAAGKPTDGGGQWVTLFNGKDLTGWKAHGEERWTVDDGEIHGVAVTKEYGYLSTDKTYRDFELKARFKAEGTGNSGVFYHSTLDGVDIKGVQVEVDPHPGMHTGGLYESGGRGWLIQPKEAAEKALVADGWNDIRAVVKGNHIQTWVNGVPAVDYTDPAPKYTDGVIALQLHAGGEGKMRFKDVMVREIR